MGDVRIRHSIREIATQPVILWILLGGKPKRLPLNFGFNDVMRTAPISQSFLPHPDQTSPECSLLISIMPVLGLVHKLSGGVFSLANV